MKSLGINFVFSSIFAIILLTTCEKEPIQDYRNIYEGNYKFYINYAYPIWIDTLYHVMWIDTNYIYEGSVKKSYIENMIIVDWGNDTITSDGIRTFTQKSELAIDSSGNLSYPEYPNVGHTRFWPPAYINGDTLRFTIGSGGLMYYSVWEIFGQKK